VLLLCRRLACAVHRLCQSGHRQGYHLGRRKERGFNAKENYEFLKLALIYKKEKWNDDQCAKHEEKMLKILYKEEKNNEAN